MIKTNVESCKCVYCKEFFHLCKCQKGTDKVKLIDDVFGGVTQ